MDVDDAWKLYLGPGGKTVENRNRIVSLLYTPLSERLTETMNDRYVDAMLAELGMVLMREIEHATRKIQESEFVSLIRRKPLGELDFPPDVDVLKLAEKGMFDVDEYYVDREREIWKTGPDGAVDDPTIRRRPYSASLIAAEEHPEATGAESVLVRESGDSGT